MPNMYKCGSTKFRQHSSRRVACAFPEKYFGEDRRSPPTILHESGQRQADSKFMSWQCRMTHISTSFVNAHASHARRRFVVRNTRNIRTSAVWCLARERIRFDLGCLSTNTEKMEKTCSAIGWNATYFDILSRTRTSRKWKAGRNCAKRTKIRHGLSCCSNRGTHAICGSSS